MPWHRLHAIRGNTLIIGKSYGFETVPKRYPVSPTLGIVFVRIAPCITELVAAPFRKLLVAETEDALRGHRVVLRRDGWQFVE
jgi:hypothetical protein